MTISAVLWQPVRRRAQHACEYCGVWETDAGGELTLDHYQPTVHGGSDGADNLLHCRYRCNLYKADYWPQGTQPRLWNPRAEPAESHFLCLADGTLLALTSTGEFTLKRLRLNRPPLVAHRARKLAKAAQNALLARQHELLTLLEKARRQQIELLEEQRILLEEYRSLLRQLLAGED